ncbi:MAG: HEAT repeat domain-containing protein [Planctomycetota bacterium]
MRPALLFLFAIGACAGVEVDMARVDLKEGVVELINGGDRGTAHYVANIQKSIAVPSEAGRYQYVGEPHVSNYLVQRSVRRLGRSKARDIEELLFKVDRFVFVATRDPVGAVRATACLQLGRVLLDLPLPPQAPPPADPKTPGRVHQIALDLAALQARIAKQEPVTQEEVVERVQALAAEYPADLLNATQMIRALASPPVSAGPPKVRAGLERVAPGVVRDCILVILRDLACGESPSAPPDPSPAVRGDAARILRGARSPIARDEAVARLADRVDPKERDPDVRKALLAYLAEVGDPYAFEVAFRRLDDVDPGVRLQSQEALRTMTRADVAASPAAWESWRAERPEWHLPLPGEEAAR